MKAILYAILSVLMFVSSLRNGWLVIDYKVNATYYETHCVNKNFTKTCKGKCHLQSESEKQNNTFEQTISGFIFNVIITDTLCFKEKVQEFPFLTDIPFVRIACTLPNNDLDKIPKPPQAIPII